MRGIMKRHISNENGTALIIAMIFLGLLTTIGLFAIFNSSTELTSSARYKSNKEAFYAAEGAIEYVKGDGYYFTTRTTMAFPDNDLNPHPDVDARDLSAQGTTATGAVTYINSGNPPPGYGFSAKDTSASYFVIEATGTSPAGARSIQEENIAKILPKS